MVKFQGYHIARPGSPQRFVALSGGRKIYAVLFFPKGIPDCTDFASAYQGTLRYCSLLDVYRQILSKNLDMRLLNQTEFFRPFGKK